MTPACMMFVTPNAGARVMESVQSKLHVKHHSQHNVHALANCFVGFTCITLGYLQLAIAALHMFEPHGQYCVLDIAMAKHDTHN